MTNVRAVVASFTLLSMICGSTTARAELPESTELSGYSMVSWDQKDGLPAGIIYSMAQDAAGYLWLAMDDGLIRFDGFQFTRAVDLPIAGLPPDQVRAIRAGPDGSLWVGFAYPGGIARIADGRVRVYGESDGLPRAALVTLATDSRGQVWAGTEAGLYHLLHDRWTATPPDPQQPCATVESLFVTKNGELLVALLSGVYRQIGSRPEFQRLSMLRKAAAGQDRPRGLTEDAQGRVWVTDPVSGFSIIDGPANSISAEHGRGMQLLTDSRRQVWVATFGEGLWTVASSGDHTDIRRHAALGAAAPRVTALFEDREHNVWAAVVDSLVRLSPHKVTPLTGLGIVTAVQATSDGKVWVGTYDHGVLEFQHDAELVARHLPNSRVRAMHSDPAGVTWVATDRSIVSLRHGAQPLSVTGSERLTQIEAITSDHQGNLWIYDSDAGLFRWDGEHLITEYLPPGIRNARVVMYGDSQDRLWIAFDNGQDASVAVRGAEGHFQVLGLDQNVPPGQFRTIYEDRHGNIWLSGFNNLIGRFSGGRFTTQAGKLDNSRAIIEDDSGRFWISAGPGILAVEPGEFEAAERARRAFEYMSFDRLDGVAGTSTGFLFGPQNVARAADGRLWFVTGAGITVVNPQALRTSGPYPRPRIDHVVTDGEVLSVTAASELRPSVGKLELFYAALNLSSPHKTRFKYWLEGFDDGWIDAGTRRQAVYTNLPPGRYAFHVQATTGDVSQESVTAWPFRIRPALYQRLWFWPSVAVIVTAALAAAWSLRLRRVRKNFVVLLEERARLSREIHDTLLQGLVGVALQFDVIAHELGDSKTRTRLKRMQSELERYVRDARQAIWDLRSIAPPDQDLVSALRECCEATLVSGIACELRVVGQPRRCSPRVTEQLLNIAREAITNAARHGRPRSITVTMQFAGDSLALRVHDDGIGFDQSAVVSATNHFGLTSMRERAQMIAAHLQIDSQPGCGTTIEAVVGLE